MSNGTVDQALFLLAKDGLTAESWIYAHNGDGFDGLSAFFQSMSESWRGWDGERIWASLEGDLTMTAKHDGHVRLAVRIRATTDWSAEAKLTLDPGEELSSATAALNEVFGL